MEAQGINSNGNKKKSKFGNIAVNDPDYGRFDSKHEHRIFHELLLRAKAGEIRDLKKQVRFKFGDIHEEKYVLTESGRHLTYIADFTYEERVDENDWKYVVSDAKGMKTKEYLIKKSLMRYFHGIDILEC